MSFSFACTSKCKKARTPIFFSKYDIWQPDTSTEPNNTYCTTQVFKKDCMRSNEKVRLYLDEQNMQYITMPVHIKYQHRLNENKLLHLIGKSWFILVIPILAIISCLWSDIPQLTLRGGLQLLLTTIFSLVFSAVIRYELFIKILGGCFFITMLMCLVSERYALNGMTGEYSLIGIFNSKNFLSMNSAISVFVGIAI